MAWLKGGEEKEGLTSFLRLNPLSLWMQIGDSRGLKISTVTYLSVVHTAQFHHSTASVK